MGASIEMDVNDGMRLAALQALLARGLDLSPLMDEIGSYLQTSTDARFENETGPDGERWLPSMRALAEGGQTLSDTGRLRQSLTHRAGRDSVEIGTNVIYAGPHQFGAEIVPVSAQALKFSLPGGGFVQTDRVEMPPRPFLGINGEDRFEIGLIVNDFLREALSP